MYTTNWIDIILHHGTSFLLEDTISAGNYPSIENKMVQTRVGEKIKHSKVII